VARAREADDDEALADAWARMLPLFVATRDAFFSVFRRYGITPPHGHALLLLADAPRPMRELAEQMDCDASYITAIVDRLEEAGLAVRRASDRDRRVKEVALTDRGRACIAAVRRVQQDPPAALQVLSGADRRALAKILARLPDAEAPALWLKAAAPARRGPGAGACAV